MGKRQDRRTLPKGATAVHDGKRGRRGNKRAAYDRREREVELVSAVRLAVTLLELIWALVRDHIFLGAGHGPLF